MRDIKHETNTADRQNDCEMKLYRMQLNKLILKFYDLTTSIPFKGTYLLKIVMAG